MKNPYLVLFLLFSCSFNRPNALIILAHFDDETMMSRTLYTLKNSHNLYFIYLTQGEGGSDIRDRLVKGEKLRQIRIKENDKVMELVNAKKRFILNAPDVPLRIPEKNYPNPKGRPTTDITLFEKSKIWNFKELINKTQAIVNIVKPSVIYTLSDEKGIVHAHHQGAEKITRSLSFKNSPKAIYGILENRYYENKFKNKGFIVKNESEKMNNFVYKLHQAYLSQMVSRLSKKELKRSIESLYKITL